MVTFAAATPRSAVSTGPAVGEPEIPLAGAGTVFSVGAAGISAPGPVPALVVAHSLDPLHHVLTVLYAHMSVLRVVRHTDSEGDLSCGLKIREGTA